MTAAIQTSNIAQEVTRTMQKRMEDAIRQFIQTARIMNDALLICDPAGHVTAFNPAAQRLFEPVPLIPLYPNTCSFLVRPEIDGISANPLEIVHFNEVVRRR